MPLSLIPKTAPPAWVFPKAKYDLDFANRRYFGGSIYHGSGNDNARWGSLMTEGNSGASANTLLAPGEDGFVRGFPQYALRITPGRGLWVEGNYTNFALWSRDHTQTAWTKSSMTATLNATGAGGTANTATTLTATGANGTSLQSITLTSRQFKVSAYIKRVSGTGAVSLTVDNGATYTDISGQINSTSFTLVSIPAQTLANPVCGVKISTSGDSIAIDHFQCEDSPVTTTPMTTTSATNTRQPEASYFNTTGTAYNDGQRLLADINNGHPCTALIQYSANISSLHLLFGDISATFFMTGGSAGNALTLTNAATNSVVSTDQENMTLGLINKACGRMNGSTNGLAVCLNGGSVVKAAGTFSPSQALAHGGMGNRGAGDYPLNGYISRATLWNTEITDGEMIAYTTITNNA